MHLTSGVVKVQPIFASSHILYRYLILESSDLINLTAATHAEAEFGLDQKLHMQLGEPF